jgi:uncharacterized membrane protein YiaA
MKQIKHIKARTLQLIFSVLVLLVGIALLFIGILNEPIGEIHNSVIIVWGEILTFVGAVTGVDYSYRYRMAKIDKSDEDAKD